MSAPRQSPTMIRNLDPVVWQQLKREARLHDLSAGALASLVLGEWLGEHCCASSIHPLESVERDN